MRGEESPFDNLTYGRVGVCCNVGCSRKTHSYSVAGTPHFEPASQNVPNRNESFQTCSDRFIIWRLRANSLGAR